MHFKGGDIPQLSSTPVSLLLVSTGVHRHLGSSSPCWNFLDGLDVPDVGQFAIQPEVLLKTKAASGKEERA